MIRITKDDILEMVRHSMKALINEISVADAYTRFYNGKIPEQAYKLLMQGTTVMTPFHKLCLDLFLKKEMSYTAMEYAGTAWKEMSDDARQYTINVVKSQRDEILNERPWAFLDILKGIVGMKSHTENSYRERGYEVLYQDENIAVTCTKSYTASCKLYGDSHWCTASDMFGEYNGFDQFDNYTNNSDGFLVQFVDKHNRENSYQVQYTIFASKVNDECICNWNDISAGIDDIAEMLGKYGVDYNEIYAKYIGPNAVRLSRETDENLKDERQYYGQKYRERVKAIKKKITSRMASPEFKQSVAQTYKLAKNTPPCRQFFNIYYQDNEEPWGQLIVRDVLRNGNRIVIVRYLGETTADKNFITRMQEEEEEYGEEKTWSVLMHQAWIISKSDEILGIYNGEINGLRQNIVSIGVDDDEYSKCIALVNGLTGKMVIDGSKISDVNLYARNGFITAFSEDDGTVMINPNTGEITYEDDGNEDKYDIND